MPSIDFYRTPTRRHRTPWHADEIKRLLDAVAMERNAHADSMIDWRLISKRVGTRDRVQCYQRYTNIDRAGKTNTKRRSWTIDETIRLLKWHVSCGHNWSTYSSVLPKRTPAEIKGKFLSLQRAVMSKNSDVWRIDEYAPYREYLRESLCRTPRRRQTLAMCIGASQYRQLQLIWTFKRTPGPFVSPPDRNISTFPLLSNDYAGRRGSSKRYRGRRLIERAVRFKTL